MEERTAKIDAYLSDSMTSEERKNFESTLENDVELRKELELQQKTVALLEAAAFIDTKNKVLAMNQQKSSSSIGGNLLKIAAVLLVLVIPTYFILNTQYNDAHLFADYSEPYPDRITTMGSTDKKELTEAMSAYNKEEYAKAAKQFNSIRTSRGDDTYVVYEAVSLTYSNQALEAIELLKTSLKGTTSNRASLEWQLVLSLLANDQGKLASDVLKRFLKNNDGYQQEKAEALQKDLNRIWR